MRDIKFRAWNGHAMEYGGFSVHASNGDIIPTNALTAVQEDSPLMQCTGLKDVNGKDIYEGDILLIDERRTVKVLWHEQAGAWDSRYVSDTSKERFSVVKNSSFKSRARLIGNIHQNPELMESNR